MVDFDIKHFKELSTQTFHDALQLRINVFVVEQNCPYPELDDKDLVAYHVLGLEDGRLVAVARILPPGISYKEPSIGRFAVAPTHRKQKLGHLMMEACHASISQLFPKSPIRISAQEYLKDFYGAHGYQHTGKSYLEDGIPHIEMLKSA